MKKLLIVVLLSVLMALMAVMFSSCGRTKGETPCQRNARQRGKYYLSQGYDVRYGHGFHEETRHMWCEYYDVKTGRWLMAKDTIRNVNGGHPVEAYGGYRVTWYGEKYSTAQEKQGEQ